MMVPVRRRYRNGKHECRHVRQTVYRKDGDMKTPAWQTDGKKASEIIREKIRQAGGAASTSSLSTGNTGMTSRQRETASHVRNCRGHSVLPCSMSSYPCCTGLAEVRKKDRGAIIVSGHDKCSGDTVVGVIALEYLGKQEGDSVIDPVFVLAAVLDWAGIAANERGKIRRLS